MLALERSAWASGLMAYPSSSATRRTSFTCLHLDRLRAGQGARDRQAVHARCLRDVVDGDISHDMTPLDEPGTHAR